MQTRVLGRAEWFTSLYYLQLTQLQKHIMPATSCKWLISQWFHGKHSACQQTRVGNHPETRFQSGNSSICGSWKSIRRLCAEYTDSLSKKPDWPTLVLEGEMGVMAGSLHFHINHLTQHKFWWVSVLSRKTKAKKQLTKNKVYPWVAQKA